MAKALAPDVSTWPAADPQLIGSRCAACRAVTWPRQARCPRCSGPDMAEELLPRRGTLIAWTTQGFVPKLPYAGKQSAEAFVSFGIGLVQLGDAVRVETRLTTADPAELRIGREFELTFVPFYVDDAGDEVLTVAFAPVDQPPPWGTPTTAPGHEASSLSSGRPGQVSVSAATEGVSR